MFALHERKMPHAIGWTTKESHTGLRKESYSKKSQVMYREPNGMVYSLNYVNGDYRLVLPFPKGDWYLINTGIPAVREHETVIGLTLIPGLLDYYRERGLIPRDSHVVEVEPQIPELRSDTIGDANELRVGHPFTNPLAILQEQIIFENGNNRQHFVSTFSNDSVDRKANHLGFDTLKRPDSFRTNNKAEFRKAAQKYGYSVLPGKTFSEEKQIKKIVKKYKKYKHGMWLKFPTGSGGDLVVHIEHLSKKSVKEGIQSIRQAVAMAFQKADFGDITIDTFWPPHKLTPDGISFVIESDARNHGEIVVNGSTKFITHRKRPHEIVGHYKQETTPEGEYLGNRPYHPDRKIDRLIRRQIKKVARYNAEKNHYFGWQGVDWFIIRRPDGKLRVDLVELNSRPTANTPPIIIAQKLGAEEWINTNAYTDRDILTMKDYKKVIGEDLAEGNINSTGLVIPQAFRTIVTRRHTIPSRNFKILIMGRSAQHCDEIKQKLEQRGVRFTPPQAA